jgi:hypothetical protein
LPFAERNRQVQAFAADRPDHAFAERIRLWNADGCFQDCQTHRLKGAIDAFRVDGVAIVDHESLSLIAPDDHTKLLCRPARGRMRRHVPMPTAMAQGTFYHLDAPVTRLGAMHVPIPFSPPLEDATVPTRFGIAPTGIGIAPTLFI